MNLEGKFLEQKSLGFVDEGFDYNLGKKLGSKIAFGEYSGLVEIPSDEIGEIRSLLDFSEGFKRSANEKGYEILGEVVQDPQDPDVYLVEYKSIDKN